MLFGAVKFAMDLKITRGGWKTTLTPRPRGSQPRENPNYRYRLVPHFGRNAD